MEILSKEKESKRNKVLSKRQELDERFKRLTATVLLITTFLVAALSGCAKGNNQNNPTTTPTSTIETVKPSDQPTSKPSPTIIVTESPTYTESPTPTVIQLTEAQSIVKARDDLYDQYTKAYGIPDNEEDAKNELLDIVCAARGYKSEYYCKNESALMGYLADAFQLFGGSGTPYMGSYSIDNSESYITIDTVTEMFGSSEIGQKDVAVYNFFLERGDILVKATKNSPSTNQTAQEIYNILNQIYIDGNSIITIDNNTKIDLSSISPMAHFAINEYLYGTASLIKVKAEKKLIDLQIDGKNTMDKIIEKIGEQGSTVIGHKLKEYLNTLIPLPDGLYLEIDNELQKSDTGMQLTYPTD